MLSTNCLSGETPNSTSSPMRNSNNNGSIVTSTSLYDSNSSSGAHTGSVTSPILSSHNEISDENNMVTMSQSIDSINTVGLAGGMEVNDVRTLFVSGLPMDTKSRELYLLFRSYPGYLSSTLKPSGKNGKPTAPVGFVTFDTREQAEKAMSDLQGVKFDPEGTQQMRLEFARSNTKVTKPKTPTNLQQLSALGQLGVGQTAGLLGNHAAVNAAYGGAILHPISGCEWLQSGFDQPLITAAQDFNWAQLTGYENALIAAGLIPAAATSTLQPILTTPHHQQYRTMLTHPQAVGTSNHHTLSALQQAAILQAAAAQAASNNCSLAAASAGGANGGGGVSVSQQQTSPLVTSLQQQQNAHHHQNMGGVAQANSGLSLAAAYSNAALLKEYADHNSSYYPTFHVYRVVS